MEPDEPTSEEQIEQLPEDGATPFQPADPTADTTGNTTDPLVQEAAGADLPDDHPATDDKLDETELYNEGIGGGAEASDNSGQSAVTDMVVDDQGSIGSDAL